MPTLSDSDSAPELSDNDVSIAAGSDNNESPAEEQGGRSSGDEDNGEEEEEEEEEVEEEEEKEVDRESNGGEEYDEELEVEEEVVEEVEEEEEGEGEEGDGDGREECDDLSVGDAKDTSMKIEPEEHGEGMKPVFSTPERSNSKSTTTHTKDGSGDNLTAHEPSNSVAQLEKETSAEASKDDQEAHDSHQSHLALGDPMSGENIRSLRAQENELAVEKENVKSDSVVVKESPHPHTVTNLRTPESSNLSSMRTPQRRPRSSSPGATIENAKRPATVCDFFARGWCIKGNSCKFVHQKEGAFNTTQQMGDQSGSSRKGDFFDITGSKKGDERLGLSASQQLLDSSNTESSSKSSLILQRALVRAYGAQSIGDEFLEVDVPQSSRTSNPPMDDFRQTMVREEYKRPFGVSPHFGSADERQSGGGDFLSRRYLDEGKLQPEISRGGDSLNVSPFTRGSPLTRNTLVPDYRYYSGASSAASSRYQNSDRDSYTPYDFINPTHSVRISPPIPAFAKAGMSSTDFDRGNYDSRSASLPRNSSPFYSRTGVENSGQKTQVQDAWEPSVLFRSSFSSEPANTSSPGSQYDPLRDSIEPPKAGSITFQTPHINGDPILSGNHTPQNPINLFPKSHEGILPNTTSPHGLSGYNTVVAEPGLGMVDGGKFFIPKEEKHLNYGHVVDGANQEDKGRYNKESKAMKFFRSALVDFLKELVKPSWREGHLSKDAHKMVVKKAVEKVLSAMHPHQVPSTAESVNQYLSVSRPKLLKLVEGYVEKYAKS